MAKLTMSLSFQQQGLIGRYSPPSDVERGPCWLCIRPPREGWTKTKHRLHCLARVTSCCQVLHCLWNEKGRRGGHGSRGHSLFVYANIKWFRQISQASTVSVMILSWSLSSYGKIQVTPIMALMLIRPLNQASQSYELDSPIRSLQPLLSYSLFFTIVYRLATVRC